jgi:hypothetical protein
MLPLLIPMIAAVLGAAGPVFETGVAAATKDKPQSKLWFAQGTWWAWMPQAAGSSLWRRAGSRWERRSDLSDVLGGLPGQADVWADGNDVAAVLVEKHRLAFVRARLSKGTYELASKPAVFAAANAVETATLARDSAGRWWIAYNEGRRMYARASRNEVGDRWQEPVEVTERKAGADDICAIAAMPGGVGVIWSDQEHDAVLFRFHPSKHPDGRWGPVETVQSGNRTADDHFHTALAADGTLYVATKNSVDAVGRPQLVLRVRDRKGRWTNHPYAPRTATGEPSRPIALIGGERLYLLHSIYRKAPPGFIAMQSTALRELRLDVAARKLLDAAVPVNNVTGPKAAFPADAPWIVLASDDMGRVYEADIRRFGHAPQP